MEKIEIDPDTRMNSLSITTKLNNWVLELNKRKPLFEVKLNLTAHNNMEFLNNFLNFLDKDIYAAYAFMVKDRRQSLTLPIAKTELMDFQLPVYIESMTRGGILNSVTCFNFSLAFALEHDEVIRLLNFLKNRTQKDLKYEVIRVKKSPTPEERLRNIKKAIGKRYK